MHRAIVLGASALVVGALLAACSTGSAPDPADPVAARTALEQVDAHNTADVAFLRDMVPHHVQGKELTDLVARRSTNPALRDLAALMDRQGGAEIGQLRGMLTSWGEATTEPLSPQATAMMGMASPQTLERLNTLSGAAFDRSWLQTMIRHHEGAVAMARQELDGGSQIGAHNIAVSTLAIQQRQIDQMRAMLAGR